MSANFPHHLKAGLRLPLNHNLRRHQRVKLAQTMRAHLLVSLHADALNNRSVRGASVYRLSPKSSGAQAEELATNNNLVVLAGSSDTHELPLA
ncbi:N-acetylmuramoyl-L-alanine amidase [Agrobacterium tumefaciens]|uniref:N-acetylmuramoyl-L-alanine amidase n=1 Tax=Agrobacterium tumefaciens TaxID=358 RepID=UPI0009B861AB